MRRRQITERQELPLPSLRLDWHSDSPSKKRVIFDSSPSESTYLAAPVSCGIEEPSRCRTRKGAHKTAAAPTRRTTDEAGAELGNGNRLFASLLFRKIRPHPCVASEAERTCSPQTGRVLVAAPNVRSLSPRRSRWSATIAQATSPDSLSKTVETLFTQLAMRRLRSLAAKQRPS
jgi:hypothetical protein